MRLSQVFGISPEEAAQLEKAGIVTVQDLAKVTDVAALNARSEIPLETLEQWHAASRQKAAAYRRRLRVITILGLVTAVLVGTISFWVHKRFSPVAHYNRGDALYDKGDLDAAIAEYRKALAIKPDDADAHYNLGIVLGDKGNLDAAIAEYRKALAIQPDDAKAHYNLGLVLYNMGDLDAAIAEYRNALDIKPDLAEARQNLNNALNAKAVDVNEFRSQLQSENGIAIPRKYSRRIFPAT